MATEARKNVPARPHLNCQCPTCARRGEYEPPEPVLIGYTPMKDGPDGKPVPLSDEELHELEGRLPSGRADWNVDFRERKWWKEFDSLLRALSKKPDAAIFSRPVDPISDGIPDYFDIIHHPMDLGTIRQRLDTDFYVHPEDFIDDVRRVFRNCFTYNKEDSPVAKMGARLSQIFEHDLHKKFLHIDV